MVSDLDDIDVWFKLYKGEVIAIFKNYFKIDNNGNSVYLSYSHSKQHFNADKKLKYLKNATKSQYYSLLKELTEYGYLVNVIPRKECKAVNTFLTDPCEYDYDDNDDYGLMVKVVFSDIEGDYEYRMVG